MGIAAPSMGKESISSLLFRLLMLISIFYPLIIIALWVGAEKLKTSNPALALILVAIPVFIIYGFYAFEKVKSYAKQKEVQSNNQKLITNLNTHLKQRQYKEALSLFNDPTRGNESYFLENSKSQGFDLSVLIQEQVSEEQINDELITELLLYCSPSLTGVTRVHRGYLNPNDQIQSTDISEKILQLLLKWRDEKRLSPNLAYHWRWVWDRLELYAFKKEHLASQQMKNENLVLYKMFDAQFTKEETVFRKQVGDFDLEALNKKGKIFGTPLHAALLNNFIKNGEYSKRLVKFIYAEGGRLDKSEKNTFLEEELRQLIQ